MFQKRLSFVLRYVLIIIVFIISAVCSYYLCPYVIQRLHTPTVSVVMSTYNRSKDDQDLLSRAINSILNQTYKDFELIIINDGSDDKTAEVLQNFANQDKRIIILTNTQNKGLPYSLNRGLDQAQGKYIARMDDDDYSLNHRLEKQVHFLDNNPHITATGCPLIFENSNTPRLFPSDPDEAKIWTFSQVPVIHPCAMIKRSFIEKHNIRYVETYPNAEDMPFWYDITIKHNGLISNLPDILLYKKPNAKKAKDYVPVQNQSVARYQHDAFHQIIKDRPCSNLCECYKSLAESEDISKILNVEKLKNYTNKIHCPPDNALHIVHPFWNDYLVFDDEARIHRFQTNHKATSLEKNTNYITIKWDDWGVETFVKNKDNIYYLKK